MYNVLNQLTRLKNRYILIILDQILSKNRKSKVRKKTTAQNQVYFFTDRNTQDAKGTKGNKRRMRMRSCMLSKYKRRNERNSWNSVTRH